MPIQTVLRLGNPLLHERSVEVEDPQSSDVQLLINDMFETMKHHQGAGLAAPQIGILRRIVIFGFESNPRYPSVGPIPETVLINPIIEILGTEKTMDWEGCLSIPGMRGKVERAHQIRYSGYNHYGKKIIREADGFHARVVLHECDHLDGILYIQRMKEMTEFGFINELEDSSRCTVSECDTPKD